MLRYRVHTRAGRGTETILHTFIPENHNGESPIGTPVADMRGNLYAAAKFGGANRSGTRFEFAN